METIISLFCKLKSNFKDVNFFCNSCLNLRTFWPFVKKVIKLSCGMFKDNYVGIILCVLHALLCIPAIRGTYRTATDTLTWEAPIAHHYPERSFIMTCGKISVREKEKLPPSGMRGCFFQRQSIERKYRRIDAHFKRTLLKIIPKIVPWNLG